MKEEAGGTSAEGVAGWLGGWLDGGREVEGVLDAAVRIE